MKKFISVAVAVMMLFAVSAPAFATTASYLPAATTLYAFDFDSLADGTSASSAVSSNYTGLTNNKGSQTKELGTDAVKGGKSLHLITSEGVWEGLSYTTTSDFAVAEGQYLIFELSTKNVTDITLQVGVSPFRFMALSGNTLKAFNETQTIGTVDSTAWNHFVVQVAPTTATAAVTIWKNGEQVFTGSNSNGKTTNLSGAWSKSRLQLTANEGGYVDDLKAWISTTAYNPSAAGDIVAITSTDFAIEDDKITYEGVSTLGELYEKLSVTTGGEIVFVDANGEVIEDPETAISEDVQVVARSASGAVVKVYTAKEKEPPALTSTVYTVDDDAKTISGVPVMTKVNDFKAGLTAAAGKTLAVSSSNGYVDSATTVTVDGTAYTVSNEIYFDYDIGSTTLGQLGNKGLTISQVKTSSSVTSTNDVLKGGKAIVCETPSNGVLHATLVSGRIPALATGDVVNVEFNIKADGYHTSQAGYQYMADAVKFNADGTITVLRNYDAGIKYVPGEWYHIVMSFGQKNLNGTYSTFKLYINGELIENPDRSDALFPNSGMNIVGQVRISLSSDDSTVNTDTTTIMLDDVKCYKAAVQGYDEAYMTGNQLVTSSNYVVQDKVVYVPADSVADALYALNFPVDPVDATGNTIDPDSMEIGDVFYIKEGTSATDTDASRVSKYTIAETNVLKASGDKLSAALNENGVIIAAAYDENGNLVSAKAYNVDMEKTTVDLSSLSGATVKAYLWSDVLKPYSVLTKGADGTWK